MMFKLMKDSTFKDIKERVLELQSALREVIDYNNKLEHEKEQWKQKFYEERAKNNESNSLQVKAFVNSYKADRRKETKVHKTEYLDKYEVMTRIFDNKDAV